MANILYVNPKIMTECKTSKITNYIQPLEVPSAGSSSTAK